MRKSSKYTRNVYFEFRDPARIGIVIRLERREREMKDGLHVRMRVCLCVFVTRFVEIAFIAKTHTPRRTNVK